MAKKFLTSIDLNGNQLIHPILENLTDNPATTAAGRLAYNTSTDKPIVRGNTGWTSLMAEIKYPNLVSIENIATAKGYLKKNSAGSWSIVNETYSLTGHKHVWEDITDRPTKLSQFTNDPGYISSYVDTTYTAGTGLTLTKKAFSVNFNDTVDSTSKILAATANSVKTAYDRGSLGVTNAATAQAKANSAYTLANGKWTYNADTIAGVLVNDATNAAQLKTPVEINGTSFDGTADIITDRWGTTRTLSFTGDVTGSSSVNGSESVATTMTLKNVATAGTYKSVTVNKKGLVTAGTNPTTLSGYGITDAASLTKFNALNNLFNSMFEIDGTMIKVKKPLYSVGEITAFGKAAGSGATGGGGTATTELRLLEDVALTSLATNNILIYNGSKWVNSTMAAISPDMQGYASEQYVQGEIANLIGGAPAHLDTLIEISELLGADSNYSGTIVQAIGERVVKNSKAPATTNTGGILKIKHDSKGLVTASQAVASADFTTALLGSGTASAATYLTGAKTWVTFENSVRGTKLTGLTVSPNSTIVAADTLITALGKLQAQINSKTTSTGTVTSVKAGTGLAGGTITTTGTISHATGNGWNHIPLNGGNGQLLQYSSTGTAKWATWKKTGVFSTSSTEYTIAHGLGNADVIAQVYSSTGEAVECDINVDATNVIFNFNVAPAINAYKYVIIG